MYKKILDSLDVNQDQRTLASVTRLQKKLETFIEAITNIYIGFKETLGSGQPEHTSFAIEVWKARTETVRQAYLYISVGREVLEGEREEKRYESRYKEKLSTIWGRIHDFEKKLIRAKCQNPSKKMQKTLILTLSAILPIS